MGRQEVAVHMRWERSVLTTFWDKPLWVHLPPSCQTLAKQHTSLTHPISTISTYLHLHDIDTVISCPNCVSFSCDPCNQMFKHNWSWHSHCDQHWKFILTSNLSALRTFTDSWRACRERLRSLSPFTLVVFPLLQSSIISSSVTLGCILMPALWIHLYDHKPLQLITAPLLHHSLY